MAAPPDSRVFLDTNVFLYAAGRDHPLKAQCVDILTRVAAGDLEAVTSSEVIQEILYVLDRRGLRTEGPRLAAEVTDLFPDLLPVTDDDTRQSCRLLQDYPSLPVRDAVHCSVMSACGIARILTADTHFDQVPGIQRLDPALHG